MEKQSTAFSNKGIIALVAGIVVLLAAVVVQSVLLYRMSERMDESRAAPGARMPSPAQTNAHDTSPRPAPLDNWFDRPFDSDGWDPYGEMQQMRKYMNRMFDDSFWRFDSSPRFGMLAQQHPGDMKLDIREEEKRFVVRVDLPGIEDADLKVNVDDDRRLTIKATRETDVEKADKKGRLLRRERRLGTFERSVDLPSPVDAGGMKVEHEGGVVTILLPKKTP